jgi:hypothetical protein
MALTPDPIIILVLTTAHIGLTCFDIWVIHRTKQV